MGAESEALAIVDDSYSMDRPRASGLSGYHRRVLLSSVTVALIGGGLIVDRYWLDRPARYDWSDFAMATVQRGAMTLSVAGAGRLIPVAERWITCKTSGTVKQVFVQPGNRVESGVPIVELVNPLNRKAVEQAKLELAEARAGHQALLADIADRRLTARARLVDYRAAYDETHLQLEAETNLLQRQTISSVDYRRTQIRAEQALANLEIEELRIRELECVLTAERSASEAKLSAKEIELRLAEEDVESLTVSAETEGVVQAVLAEPGQQVTLGQKIARVANTEVLIGRVRVPESYARHVSDGQPAMASVLNAEIPSTVTRVDPAVTEGSVIVDLRFDKPLPAGARPELSLRVSIIFAQLQDVLHVRRPLHVKNQGIAEVYRMAGDMRSAVRTSVRFGDGTHGRVEVIGGLKEGDVLALGGQAGRATAETLYFR